MLKSRSPPLPRRWNYETSDVVRMQNAEKPHVKGGKESFIQTDDIESQVWVDVIREDGRE